MTEEIKISPENYIKKSLEDDEKIRKHIYATSLQARFDNIKQIRDLIKHFILISSGIIGITIPVLGRIDLVKNLRCLRGALFILLIIISYGFYYLTRILSEENRGLEDQYNKFIKILDESRDCMNNFIKNMTKDNFQLFVNKEQEIKARLEKEEELRQKKQKPDYSLDIIFWAFFIALVLLVVSIL